MNVNDLTDSILRHAVELQALSANEEARAERILRELEGELRALLNSRTLSEAGRRQIEALIREAHDAISKKYINIAGVVDVGAVVEHVADRTVQFMRDTYPAETFTLPPTQVLKSLSRDILIDGSPASAWWDKQAEDTAFRFAGIVRNGVVNNETNEQIVRNLFGRWEVDPETGTRTWVRGLFGDAPRLRNGQKVRGTSDGLTRQNARALVHSSIMTAANRARMETYKAAFGDTSDGVRWLATLDSHTCLRCAALDGQSWDWEGNKLNGTKADFHVAPLHVNCRCVMTPLPPDFDELFGPGFNDKFAKIGARASSQGPQASGTTFSDFLKRQSPEWVEKWMGADRAKAYFAGDLTLTDLITKSGRQKTLEEL